MLVTILGLIRFGFSLLFGVGVTMLFAGIEPTRKNKLRIGLLCLLFLCVQTTSYWLLGLELTTKLYPLIIHIPLIIILTLHFKRSWLISTVSVLTAYLCCQAPRWFGFLAGAAFNQSAAEHLIYIGAVILAYYFLKRYVVESIRQLMFRSVQSCLLLAGVPFFYYAFDYFTTIYTKTLYSGTTWAVQFMPSTVSVFYFVFIILYYVETEKQTAYQRERDLLATQIRHAQIEFDALRQTQNSAAVYRHDMRHHFSHLQHMAQQGRLDEILDYLQTAQSDMDAITPVRYCENETINLILSSFAAKAQQANIDFEVDAKSPEAQPLSETELCSLFSNALENAMHACERIADTNRRRIRFHLYTKNKKLCIDIRNSFQHEPQFKNGYPFTTEPSHGYGTKSMVYIVESHNGVCQFSVQDDWFIFQATL